VPRLVPCCALLVLAAGCATTAPETKRINPFGMHGPTISHWLQGNVPNLWPEAEARFHVVAGTGAGWARQDFWWSIAEPKQGRFEWEAFDRAVAMYERHGLKLMVILCYTSAWSNGVCPDTDEERARFANYVRQIVGRYKGRVIAWEIWNEPNIQPFWSPRPSAELYAKLLKAAYKAAKEADPDCVVLGGALAGPDSDFLAGMYEHGAKGHFDALSYHNYGQALDLAEELNAIEHLRRVLRANGEPDKPIWHTESGFYTGPQGLSEKDQAARLVRYSIAQLALGIERVCQLTVADWTDDPTHHDRSVYRGVTRANYHKKVSYGAYRTMTNRLAYKTLRSSFRPLPGVRGFLFEGATEADRVLVLHRDWEAKPALVQLDFDNPTLLMQTMTGDWRVSRSADGVHQVMLEREPLYLLDPGPAVLRYESVTWPNPVASKVSKLPRAELAADAGEFV
jgi:hypothetical protein